MLFWSFIVYTCTLIVATLTLLSLLLSIGYSFALSRILPRPFYTQKWYYISELSINRYILSFDLDESRHPANVNGFFRGCPLFWTRRVHIHTCASASLIRSFWYMPPSIIPFFLLHIYIYLFYLAICKHIDLIKRTIMPLGRINFVEIARNLSKITRCSRTSEHKSLYHSRRIHEHFGSGDIRRSHDRYTTVWWAIWEHWRVRR